MLVFRKGLWQTVAVPPDPMLSHAHRQRLAACLAAGKKEAEFYQELFPGLRYPGQESLRSDQESLGKSMAPQSTAKKSAV
jgi:hypothetical protein